jgi:hypothetical protein
MRLTCFWLALSVSVSFVSAQNAKTYYENGNLKASVPVSEDGFFEGKGYTFYQDGEMAMETNYERGKREGWETEYYPTGEVLGECYYKDDLRQGWYTGYHLNGAIKLKQHWADGKKEGPMQVYFENGKLHMFALMQGDSTVFAQRFDEEGELLNEILKPSFAYIDTALMGEPIVRLEQGDKLQKGKLNTAKAFIPGVPTAFISYFSPHGQVLTTEDTAWPLALIPKGNAEHFVLYLRIKTHAEAQPVLLKKIKLGVW